MPLDQFTLACWFLAMFGMGFIAGGLVFWWITIELRAKGSRDRRRGP